MRQTWFGILLSVSVIALVAVTPAIPQAASSRDGRARAPGLAAKGGWSGALRGNRNYAVTLSGSPIVNLAPSTISTYALDYSGAWRDLRLGTYSYKVTTSVSDTTTKQTCSSGSSSDNCLAPKCSLGVCTGVDAFALFGDPSVPNGDNCSPNQSAPWDSLWALTTPLANTAASVQEPAFPIPPGTGVLIVEWDHYLDIPYGSGYVQYTEYRYFKDGFWSPWLNSNPNGAVRSGADRAWVTESDEIPEAAQADSVQLRHWIRCMPTLAPDGTNCIGGSPGLYYDNFGLFAITGVVPTPTFGFFPALAPQTTFVDGTMLGLNCAAAPCWPGIRGTDVGGGAAIQDNVNSPSGDSIVVRIHSALRRNGMGVNWHRGFDKTFGGGLTIVRLNASYSTAFGAPAVIFRLFDPTTKTWSPWDSTELDADDVQVSGTDTTVVQSAYRMDWPPRDKAGLNLPGGFTIKGIGSYSSLAFLPRGCRLQYYLKAVDVNGTIAYQFQGDAAANEVEDLPSLPGGTAKAPDIMEFDILPRVYAAGSPGSLLAGRTTTPLLDLDGSYTGWSFNQDPVRQALRGLGVRADRYRLQQAPGYANNIGGHESVGTPDQPTNYFPNMDEYSIRDSLAAWYRIIIQSGHLRNATLEDEADARLLESWWNAGTTGTNGGDRCLLVSGDDYARTLMNAAASDPSPYRVSFGNHVLGLASVSGSWNGTVSIPYPTLEDRFANPTAGPGLVAGYTYPLDCGCPGPNRFDALTRVGSAEAQNAAFYPLFSGVVDVAAVATMSEKDPITDKDRNKALAYGFSIQFARSPGIPTAATNYAHSGVQERMRVLYKFLASCRGARTGAAADSGKCWPCPTDANMTGNWAALAGFQTGVYGPLYSIQDPAVATSVGIEPGVPSAQNRLSQNRPNPFNPSTTIPFTNAVAGPTTVRIFDVAGLLVRTIEVGYQEAGSHVTRWDGRVQGGAPAASGVYFYRVQFPGGEISSRKMILLR